MLKLLISIIIINIIINHIIYKRNKRIEEINMIINIISMSIGLYLILINNNSIYNYNRLEYLSKKEIIGIDNISLSLIVLTLIIIPIVNILKDNNKINKRRSPWTKSSTARNNYKKIQIMNIISIILIGIFITLEISLIYILFELILIPMIFIILSDKKKEEAVYRLWIYTLLTSILFIPLLIIIYGVYGSGNIICLDYIIDKNILSIVNIWEMKIKEIIFWLIFIIFMVKIPIFPLHTWLPSAHVEATTSGSIILAALLLKVGMYGLIRLNINILSEICNYYYPIIAILGIISIYYSTLIIYRLIDLKRIIAYSSIIHMNLGIIALYSNNSESVIGSLINNISHGFISSSYFLLIGILYYRYKNRLIIYYKGLFAIMPIFSVIWLITNLNNLALPGTLSFISEFWIFLGSYLNNPLIGILLIFTIWTNSIYIILLINKIIFGRLTLYIKQFNDLTLTELIYSLPLLLLNILLGIFPYYINNFFLTSSYILNI